eukprot:gene11135-12306_t
MSTLPKLILLLFLGISSPKSTNAQAVVPDEASSSPSSITAMKNSAVWLNWNYTFNAYGGMVSFNRQEWIVNDTSSNTKTTIATRSALNGAITVSSSLPSSLIGRVTAISNNSTLMISNLQYNDTLLQFKSTVVVQITGGSGTLHYDLKPVVKLTIQGAPSYISTPARNIEVSENGMLSVVASFDGNPKPNAEVQWSGSSTKTSLTVNEQYKFIYNAEYTMNNTDASYCGKTLTISVKNSIGNAADIQTTVSVLLNFANPNLRAGKRSSSCVEVQWQKKEAGLCIVTYTVRFKDSAGVVYYVNKEIDKSETTRCGIACNINITQVELTMKSTRRSQTFTAHVAVIPTVMPTKVSTTKGMHTKSTVIRNTSPESNLNMEMHYMDLEDQENGNQQQHNYASLTKSSSEKAQAVVPNEALSSLSSITAMKNSAVWLHWSYTFNGAGIVNFNRQEWIVNDTSSNTFTIIATRNALNGPMNVSGTLPSSLNGRVTAISNNSTLMISNLQYNDTFLQFKSIVVAQVIGGSGTISLVLKPVVKLTIQGTPSYISTPARNIEVSENGMLSVVTSFDGNPKPNAEVQWSGSSTKTSLTVNEQYKFIYNAEYTMNNIDASYCNKTLTISVKNSIGNAADIQTTVSVLLNFANPNLRAGKRSSSCVEVKWQKKEAGLCIVTYTVRFKDSAGVVYYVNKEIDKSETTRCGITCNINITQVELTMKSTRRSQTFTAHVAVIPTVMPTKVSTTKGVHTKSTVIRNTSPESNLNMEMHYMDLEDQENCNQQQQNYASLTKSSSEKAQACVPNEALSSPSSITAMKNSAVWLHWSYTFNGGGIVNFNRQDWIVNDTASNTKTTIATRTALNGAITVSGSLPSSLNGRVTAISNNSTLMISNLQYNDTHPQFESIVFAQVVGASGTLTYDLKPVVKLTIQGTPSYISTLARNMEISENGMLSVVTSFDGNPKPSAEVQWSGSSTKTALTVNEQYKFIYNAEYTMNNIDASYCNKTLTISVKNSVGNAADIQTTVSVLLNFANPILNAGKPNSSCVEVQWQKKQAGLCSVTYTVSFKDSNGTVRYTTVEINKSGTTKCGIPTNINITQVELTMSSTKRSQTFTARVSEYLIPLPTSAHTTDVSTTKANIVTTLHDTTIATTLAPDLGRRSCPKEYSPTSLHIAYNVVIAILVCIIIVLLIHKFKHHDGKGELVDSGIIRNSRPELDINMDMHYMELEDKDRSKQQTYTTLTSPAYAKNSAHGTSGSHAYEIPTNVLNADQKQNNAYVNLGLSNRGGKLEFWSIGFRVCVQAWICGLKLDLLFIVCVVVMAPSSQSYQYGYGYLCIFFILICIHAPIMTVNAQACVPNEALSSPSSITAFKNSAVWLHWSYTFNGGGIVNFNRQDWIINDTASNTKTTIATRTALNGAITVSGSLPSSLNGRVTAISNNSTLMISNLQYNDTHPQFESIVFAQVIGGSGTLTYDLKPVVKLTIQGTPSYISTPAQNIEVSENGMLSVVTSFDGNPKPNAEVQWSGSSTKTALTVNEQYKFIYNAEYTMNNIDASYCNKTLTISVKNSIGNAADIQTTVTVLLNFANPNLNAGKPNSSCVEVQWQKKQAGLCSVTYTVSFKVSNGTVRYTNVEINKSGTTKCGIPSNINITQVELTMSSTKRSQAFTAHVSEYPIPLPTSTVTVTTPKDPITGGSKGLNTGAIIGGAVARDKDHDSGEPDYPLAHKNESHYATADEPGMRHAPEPTYADPNKPALVYGKLGEGGGRKGPKPTKGPASDYAEVGLDENGYPLVAGGGAGGPTSYTDGYGEKPRSRENSGRRAAPEGRRPPPPYTEPKLDEDGYPSSGKIPPVYAQVDKSRRKR